MDKRMPKHLRRNYLLVVLLVGVGNLAYVIYRLSTHGFANELVYNLFVTAMFGFCFQNVDALYNLGSDTQ